MLEPSASPGRSRARSSAAAEAAMTALGDHRGHERAGRHGPAELLDHDHQFRKTEARAAVLLGQVEAEPTEVAQVAPKAGQFLGLGLEQSASCGTSTMLCEKVGGGSGQGPVVIGDGDRHAKNSTPLKCLVVQRAEQPSWRR